MKKTQKLLLQAALSAILLFGAMPAPAATFTVSKLADTNDGVCDADCSLREAITASNAAAGDDTINFTGLTGIIQLESVLPDLNSNVELQGPGANLLTIRGEGVADPYRIFNITGMVNISDLAISNGRAVGAAYPEDSGGAILNAGDLTLSCVNVHDNSATGTGGAIFNRGDLSILNSTLSSNSTTNRGGALWSLGTATVSNSTLYGNFASIGSGAIRVYDGTMTLRNNTIAFNSCDGANSKGGGIEVANVTQPPPTLLSGNIIFGNSAASARDISGSFISNGFNLVGNGDGANGLTNGVNGDQIGNAASPLDPKLGPLADNGGSTKTCALQPNSPAINTGDPNFAPPPATDQRGSGFARVYNGRIDIGAYELQPFALSINNVIITEGNSDTKDAIFTVSLSPPSSKSVTVKVATLTPSSIPATAGDDYVALPPTTLTFAPGETSKSVTVQVNGDTVVEGDERFAVKLSAASNATIADSEGAGTILEDDTALSVSNVTVSEGNPAANGAPGTVNAVFTVSLSTASSKMVTVKCATGAAGSVSATAGVDYMALPLTNLTFAPGQTSKQVTVKVNSDLLNELNERFAVNLSSATNALISDSEGVGTITNDDAMPSLSIDDVSQAEGNSGTTAFTFTVSLSAPSGRTVTVKYAMTTPTTTPATAGTDYLVVPPTTLTFAPGETGKQITILVNGDIQPEGTERFAVKLSGAANATITDSEGVGYIRNDDVSAIVAEDEPSQ